MNRDEHGRDRMLEQAQGRLLRTFGGAPNLPAETVAVLADSMTINRSLEELRKNQGPFAQSGARERVEAWVRSKQIEYSYTSHTHEACVRIWKSDVWFKEGYEHFPSDHMIAQIALALAAGVK